MTRLSTVEEKFTKNLIYNHENNSLLSYMNPAFSCISFKDFYCLYLANLKNTVTVSILTFI